MIIDGEKWQSLENGWPSLKNYFYSKIEIFEILMAFSLVNITQNTIGAIYFTPSWTNYVISG